MPAASAPFALAGGMDKAAVSPNAAELPSNAPAGWWGAARKELSEREYFPSRTKVGGLQAPNRAQNFRISFTPEGVRVAPRETGKPSMASWDLTLKLKAWGGRNESVPASPLAPTAKGNRVEYRREGIVEWYVNTPKGLEQGFTVERAPARGDEIVVEVAAGGSLVGKVREDGTEMSFADKAGTRIRFGSLTAVDAAGKTLPAKFEARESGYALVVAARDAAYPVVIDPLAYTPSSVLEINQANASFGYSVAGAGDVNGDGYDDVIVGAPLYDNEQVDEGAAFVYLGSASGLSPIPDWSAESDQAGAQFGSSVASAGDVNGDGYGDVIVGALLYDNGEIDEGKVFVFLGSSGGLSTTPAWSAESDQAGAQFGFSVSSAGDVNSDGNGDVIVGAPYYDNGQTDEGAAFVYLGSAAGLSNTPAWTAKADQSGARFGNSVSGAGDVNGDGYGDVIVGAPLYDNGQTDEGKVFVYMGSTSGLATTFAWTAEFDKAYTSFGESAASAGDVNGDGYGDVIIGAPGYGSFLADTGKVFVYLGSAAGLSATYAWTKESDEYNARFGASAASAGDINGDGYGDVIVGAFGHGFDDVMVNKGMASVYLGSAAGLSANPEWTMEYEQAGACFGQSVASAGDVNRDGCDDVIVGSPYHDDGSTDEGVAFVYMGSTSGLALTAGWTVRSDASGSLGDHTNFGYSVASAGDVNDDGYDDVIVGAPGYDNGQTDEGKVFVFLGSPSGLSATYTWSAEANSQGADFGFSVASAGDVNGDGYGDVIVGAPTYSTYSSGLRNEGAAFVYLGSASGLATLSHWMVAADQSDAEFGWSVASAGDVNGDGYGDVIVGAFRYDNGQTDEGKAFLYLGSGSGLSATPAWTAESDQIGAYFGFSAASAGDVNRDGYGDVIVGAPYYDNGELNEGMALLYLGSESGLSTTPAWTAESNQGGVYSSEGPAFGYSVAFAGDVNGDSYDDVIVGSPYYNSKKGMAFVYLGSASGLSATPAWTKTESLQGWPNFGNSVATAGDVNDDGYGDVIIGASEYGPTWEGAAFLYLGSATGLSATPTWSAKGERYSAAFGNAVFSAGDVNGDDCSDVIVGSPETDTVFVFYGYSDKDLDGYNTIRGDCDDNDPAIHPGVVEQCNGLDDDCDGMVDDGLPLSVFYPDWDGDAYGDPASPFRACYAPPPHVLDGTDCDDSSDSVHPGAEEFAGNEIDENCDGVETCYVDGDEDGYRTDAIVVSADSDCTDPGEAFSSEPLDCDDTAPTAYPGAVELCNGIDDDCNGVIDNGLPATTFYVDSDGDAYGNAAGTIQACSVPDGYAVTSDDCDDSDDSIHPGAVETPEDGIDQDCNGSDAKLCYKDLDRDGYGSRVVVPAGDGTCDTAQFESDSSADCNDADPAINPGVAGIAYDGIDQNCDGVDEILGNAYEPGGNGGCFLQTLSF